MNARLEDYMREVEQRRFIQINRGASQDTIERCTFPHKYKQVRCFTQETWFIVEFFRQNLNRRLFCR